MSDARTFVSIDILHRILTEYFGYNVKVSIGKLLLVQLIKFVVLDGHEYQRCR